MAGYFPALAAAAVALAAAAPAAAQERSSAAIPVHCAADKAALEAERAAIKTLIADIATGRWHKQNRKKRKLSGRDAARAVGGTAASVLLPFPLGAAVNAAASAGKGRKKDGEAALAPGVEEPDVPALIARQQAVEAQLAHIGC
jgi:hypothetical protein